MTTRRRGRELALQILYALDANPVKRVTDAIRDVLEHLGEDEPPAADDARRWAETLVEEVSSRRDDLDAIITQTSRNWRIERMARVDRNILRLALYELKFHPDIPIRVTLNEAIELAKRFGTAESPAFINGLLDSTVKALGIQK